MQRSGCVARLVTQRLPPRGQPVRVEHAPQRDLQLRARHQADGANIICQVVFWSGFNCDADPIATNETNPLTSTTGWQSPAPETEVDGTSVTGANSVGLSCLLMPGTGTSDFYLDMLYVSKAPSHF